MGGRKARESPFPSHNPQLPPCLTREVEQFFFFFKEIQHFRFSKVFFTLQQWPVHRECQRNQTLKPRRGVRTLSPTKQRRIGLRCGKKVAFTLVAFN